MSSEDIPQGKFWRNELFPKLANSNFAVVCLTGENLDAPWLLFEAGAIARQLVMSPKEGADEERARVYTYLLDVESTAIKPPLGDLQHTKSDKPSTRKLFWEINTLQKDPLDDKEFSPLFEFAWQHIEPELKRIREMTAGQATPQRPEREMIEEILERVRQLGRPDQPAGALANILAGIMAPDAITTAQRWAPETSSQRAARLLAALQEAPCGNAPPVASDNLIDVSNMIAARRQGG